MTNITLSFANYLKYHSLVVAFLNWKCLEYHILSVLLNKYKYKCLEAAVVIHVKKSDSLLVGTPDLTKLLTFWLSGLEVSVAQSPKPPPTTFTSLELCRC